MERLRKYLKDNLIEYSESGGIITINNKTYQYVEPIEIDNKLTHFKSDFSLVHDNRGYDYIVIWHGGRYYFIESSESNDPTLTELRWLGKVNQEIDTRVFLGVHGGYELMTGSGLYSDWCKKAKFIGIEKLGLIEKGTLAGTLKFQLECLKNDIKPIIGASYQIRRGEVKYDAKFYVKDWRGWNNLLDMQYESGVENIGWVKESTMLNKLEGLVLVLDPKSMKYENVFPIDLENEIYYQLDSVEFDDNDKDIEYLKNLKEFVNSKFKPVSIRDAYYIDKKDYKIKEVLSKMANNYTWTSENQYMKTNDEYFMELSDLFKEDDDRLFDLFEEAIVNEEKIADICTFNIDTSSRHLPEYTLTEEEKEKYGNKDNMFWELIQEGLEREYPDYGDKELARIEEEMETIEAGGFVDYFLNTRDYVKWAIDDGIYVGTSRGSAGGSLISKLLEITKTDPFKYDLMFSRFLNKGRIGSREECRVLNIELENGSVKTYYPDDEIEITRNGIKIIVKAKQLKEGDGI